jgi:hypothetical protein
MPQGGADAADFANMFVSPLKVLCKLFCKNQVFSDNREVEVAAVVVAHEAFNFMPVIPMIYLHNFLEGTCIKKFDLELVCRFCQHCVA